MTPSPTPDRDPKPNRDQVEEILAQVKYTVRQGLGTAISTQLRSQLLGGRQGGNLQAR